MSQQHDPRNDSGVPQAPWYGGTDEVSRRMASCTGFILLSHR